MNNIEPGLLKETRLNWLLKSNIISIRERIENNYLLLRAEDKSIMSIVITYFENQKDFSDFESFYSHIVKLFEEYLAIDWDKLTEDDILLETEIEKKYSNILNYEHPNQIWRIISPKRTYDDIIDRTSDSVSEITKKV